MKTLALVLLLSSAPAFAEKVTVAVKGMHCASCAGTIEEKFKGVPNVTSTKASYKNSNVILETAGVKDVTDEKITEVIKEAGFKVAKIQRGK